MKTNHILKILAGTGAIATQVTTNVIDEAGNLIEDKILKNRYVTREEFEVLQKMVMQMRSELSELKKGFK